MEKWHKLAVLLDVVHKAAAAGPAYGWIVSMADDEIAKMAPKAEVPSTKVDIDNLTPFRSIAPTEETDE